MKDLALKYLERGMSVMPLGLDKRPLLASWKPYMDTRATPEEINAWWSKWPEANIGVITGKISGISVIDVDVRKGGDISLFPQNTTVVKTGNGGYHLYYKYCPEAGTIGSEVLKGIDFRNDGGYVVAPPSVTDYLNKEGIKEGGKYELWRSNLELADYPIEVMRTGRPQKAHRTFSELAGVSEGSRNDRMASLVGKMIRKEAPERWNSEIFPVVLAFNETYDPPLDKGELVTIWKSICDAELRSRQKNELTTNGEDEVEIVTIEEAAKEDVTQGEHIKTGFEKLDDALDGGIQDGDLTVVSGWTSQGKTHLCQTMTYHLANNGVPCVWFSYEVRPRELWRKFQEMGVTGNFIAYQPRKIVTGDIQWVEKKIVRAKEKFGSKVVFIDHLGFLMRKIENPNDSQLMGNISMYVGSICRELKRMALEHSVSIVLMAHTKKPSRGNDMDMSDIAFSAGISQEADTVILIKRLINDTGSGEEVYLNKTEVKLQKNRKTGITKRMDFFMDKGRLVESEESFNKDVKSLTDGAKKKEITITAKDVKGW